MKRKKQALERLRRTIDRDEQRLHEQRLKLDEKKERLKVMEEEIESAVALKMAEILKGKYDLDFLESDPQSLVESIVNVPTSDYGEQSPSEYDHN